jgi:TIR domain
MIFHWLPLICSRLRIFISYSSESLPIAEEIAQHLKNAGHSVFFDKDSLPPAADYNHSIRAAMRMSDRAIFVLTKEALAPGKYVLSELDFAKARWPSPAGRVYSVIVDRNFLPQDLPVYLRSIQAMTPRGNATTEIGAAIEQSRQIAGICWSCLAVTVLLVAALAIFCIDRLGGPIELMPDIALIGIERAHFRPLSAPPADVLAANAATDWISSQTTITMMGISYNHRDQKATRGRLLGEDIELQIGGKAYRYSWAYVVEILSDAPCPGPDWLCRKGNVRAENLEPGQITPSRETMFLPSPGQQILWKDLVDQILDPTGPSEMKVTLRSRIDLSSPTGPQVITKEFVCTIDVASARLRFTMRGFKPGVDPRPQWLQPNCIPR